MGIGPTSTPGRAALAALAAGVLAVLPACRGSDDGPAGGSGAPPTAGAPATTTAPGPPAWQGRAAAPEARQEVAGAAVGGRLWMVAGLGPAGTSTRVDVYDPAADRWSRGPDLPLALHHPAAAVLGGELVVVGGFTDGGAFYGRPSDRVLALRADRWVDLPRLRRPRGAAAAAVVDGVLHVVGGRDATGLVAPTEAFDGTAWRDRAPLPSPRDHLGAVSDGRYVWAVGGRRLDADAVSAAAERYDPATDTWQAFAPMPTGRGGHGVALLDGRIVAAGGETSSRVFAEVEALDPVAGTWAPLPPMRTPRHGLALVTVGDAVHAVGGGVRAGLGASDANEVLRRP